MASCNVAAEFDSTSPLTRLLNSTVLPYQNVANLFKIDSSPVQGQKQTNK